MQLDFNLSKNIELIKCWIEKHLRIKFIRLGLVLSLNLVKYLIKGINKILRVIELSKEY